MQRQAFCTPAARQPLEEVSVDGGKVRLRTALGEPCRWKDYKAVATDDSVVVASYQDNAALTQWVNRQPLAAPLTALGDGHDGVWNIVSQMSTADQRREILDWYHLVENLHKVGGSLRRLNRAEALLWQGKVDEAMGLFIGLKRREAKNFYHYLCKHRHRIINYQYSQRPDWLTKVTCSPYSQAYTEYLYRRPNILQASRAELLLSSHSRQNAATAILLKPLIIKGHWKPEFCKTLTSEFKPLRYLKAARIARPLPTATHGYPAAPPSPAPAQ